MSKKIGCGGFRIDDDTLKLKEDGTLYAAGGGGVTVDSELSDTSTNPVQNKVVKSALYKLDEDIEIVGATVHPVPVLDKVFEWDGVIKNRDKFSFNGSEYTKLDEISSEEAVQEFLSAIDAGDLYSRFSGKARADKVMDAYPGGDGQVFIFKICGVAVVKDAGTYTINGNEVTIPSAGIYVVTSGNSNGFVKYFYTARKGFFASYGILINSSETADKYFMLTVNDSGAISATEVTR